MKIVYEEQFRAQLKSILGFIARDNVYAAKAFRDELKARIERVPEYPEACRRSLYFEDDTIRDMVSMGYTIIYRITPKEIEKAIDQMRQSRLGLKTIRGASTMNRTKSICRVFFRWMHAVGMIPRDPSGTIAITRIQPKHTVPISDEEFENLIAVIRRHGGKMADRDEALFSVYAYTGMRRSEALNLRVGDFDIKTRSLLVHGKGGCPRPACSDNPV